METVNMMEENYERALSYGTREHDGKLDRSEERMATIGRSGTS